jgi:hypothetical protein
MSRAVAIIFGGYWASVLLLAANAAIPQVQSVGLHAFSLTLFMSLLMVAFVRRIGSLLGDKPGEDWDPKRG